MLTRLDNEKCSLEALDKNTTTIWLNAICKYCGFNEINTYQNTPTIPSKSNSTMPSNSQKSSLTSGCKSSEPHQKLDQPARINNTINKKIIAGIAASSVGSYDLCNAQLENFFKNKNSKLNPEVASKESYIDLQECLSGLDKKCDVKVSSSGVASDLSHSFSSLDNLEARKASFDEDYSVFDLDINDTNVSKHKSSMGLSNLKHHFYQDDYKNVSMGLYYNYPQMAIAHNDCINYTETFDASLPVEPVGLRYVVLENGSYDDYEKDMKKMYLVKDNLQIQKKVVSKNVNDRIIRGDQYTSWDQVRTNALKHTQNKFQRPSLI